ncbi:uncharacterized protein LOC106084434 [Stomoxys calcitrans]|uniref:DDB1- and CUL4-associated factor 15 WD40 repeat-containing domain-containing protein n=1 Tax=Stomoxys calcitrans TaxID=35570 RepID=A0A1I8NLY5_STOCA|nr:uncharacterized protein LOC106084434 [Stomoxys calcitrans]
MDRNSIHSGPSYIDLSSSEEDDDEEFSLAESSETDCEDDDPHQFRERDGQGLHSVGQFSEKVGNFRDDLIKCRQQNWAKKLLQREYMGNLRFCRDTKPLLSAVPKRLRFCFKDLVPVNFLQGHMFMGLSACGQFLLSYKVCSSESAPNSSHYPFTIGYKYTLFFWIYQPHKPLRGFYKCCLFDDHGVDNVKEVSMIQWKSCDPRILIVHGASEEENEDSYLTYIKVPKLGCLECRKQRDYEEEEGYFRRHILCIKCNLTVHTKYSTTESDRKFDPYLHLICPERILIISNGFFHMLHISLEQPPKEQQSAAVTLQSQQQQQNMIAVLMMKPLCTGSPTPTHQLNDLSPQQERRHTPVIFTPNNDNDNFSVDSQTTFNSQSNVVNRIIEDFADIETDSTHSGSGIIAITTPQAFASVGLKSPTSIVSNPDSPVSQVTVGRKSCEEFVFSCSPNVSSRANAIPSGVANTPPPPSNSASPGNAIKTNSPLFQNGARRRHRIVTKSFRKGISMFFSSTGITTTQTSSPNTSTASANALTSNDRASTYEFCEENEKCEKISILRKRRLAERKYEFSEDNSENIIPFTKTRTSANNSFSSLLGNSATGSHSPRHNRTHLHNSLSPYASPSSSPHPHSSNINVTNYGHYAAPSALSPLRHSCTSPLGFRSPPSTSGLITPNNNSVAANISGTGGGGGGTVMRSPSRHLISNNFYNNHKSPPHSLSPATQYMLSFKPHGTLSPLQLSITKRSHLERGGSISPNYQHPFLSPRRDEIRAFEVPLQGGATEKPVCTKKFQRRYVEEDDAASVITSEEDDCISPGYHTLLPVEVHGSCYSEMQMISKASFQQLRCTSVVIEQHSFDMETFTYYVISTLCQKNQKTYDFFYDWAYELINVCPITQTIFCLLMAHFSAREEVASCLNCSRKLSCAFHRRQYECRVLFCWNMCTGEWDVLDFGELHDHKLQNMFIRKGVKRNPVSLAQRAKKLAREMAQTLNKLPDYTSNLRVLDSNINKSKKTIIDIDNMIEFYLKRPRSMN